MQNWVFDIRSRKFFVLLLAFIVLSILVYSKITAQFDNSILQGAQTLGGNYVIDTIMQGITEIGNIEVLVIFSILLFIKKKTRRLGLVLILSVLAGTIVSSYLKCALGEERPHLEFAGTLIFPPEPDSTIPCLTNGSFPSGHSTRAAAFAFVMGFALCKRFPRGCYLLWIYPVLVSISRVFILEHFAMDVIGGIILGIIISDVVSKKLKLSLIFDKSEA